MSERQWRSSCEPTEPAGEKRHKRYLKEHRKATYTTLLTSGGLNAYLAGINEQAQERLERLIEQMKQAQGIYRTAKGGKRIRMGRKNK